MNHEQINVENAKKLIEYHEKNKIDEYLKIRISMSEDRYTHVTISFQHPEKRVQEGTPIPFNMLENEFRNGIKETYGYYKKIQQTMLKETK